MCCSLAPSILWDVEQQEHDMWCCSISILYSGPWGEHFSCFSELLCAQSVQISPGWLHHHQSSESWWVSSLIHCTMEGTYRQDNIDISDYAVWPNMNNASLTEWLPWLKSLLPPIVMEGNTEVKCFVLFAGCLCIPKFFFSLSQIKMEAMWGLWDVMGWMF